MKRLVLFAMAAVLFFAGCKKEEVKPEPQPAPVQPTGSEFGRALRALDIVSRIDTIIPRQNPAQYAELYRVNFRQPVDHNNPGAGSFEQKAFLFYVGNDRPTVLYTCGYTLYDQYKLVPFIDLAYNMNANLLMVEHRYFGESKPSNATDWTYLTVSQAAADHHAIIEALKPLLPREWVSTGTSKDGMTSLFLRYFYPDDITVTTAFCAPITTSLAYLPIGRYLQEESGTAEERSEMQALMGRLLAGGENGMYARFVEMVSADNLIDHSTDYSYTWYVNNCLIYFFEFFSYQTPATRQMPSLSMPTDQLLTTVFAKLFQHADYSFVYPYLIQAAKELGRPIEDFEPYADSLEGTAFDINVLLEDPCELKAADRWLYATYDSSLMADIRNDFCPNTTSPILYVYTKDDPWTGARPDRINEQHSKMIINPTGIHNHDINNPAHYTPAVREEIMNYIAQYVSFEGDPVAATRPPYSYPHPFDDSFMIRALMTNR